MYVIFVSFLFVCLFVCLFASFFLSFFCSSSKQLAGNYNQTKWKVHYCKTNDLLRESCQVGKIMVMLKRSNMYDEKHTSWLSCRLCCAIQLKL